MRALIVDDEREARQLLVEYCEEIAEIELLGESCDGYEALVDIRRWQPELVFLDVDMPGLDGFGVLANLSPAQAPSRVVFTTGYDRHALRAFEVAAIDYLLKPFDRDRFRTAVQRALGGVGEAPARWPDAEVLLVRSGHRVRAVRPHEVRWLEAAGDYARVHTAEGEFLATSGLGAIERRLDASRFLRVHRSIVVYLPAVRQLARRRRGGWEATLEGGARVPIGRKYLAGLRARFL